MRVQHHRTKITVLILAFCMVCARTPTLRPNRRHHKHDKNDSDRLSQAAERRLSQLQGRPSECCQTSTETVSPEVGRDRAGVAVELFRSPDTTQRFNETLCKADVRGKPCRYIDRHLRRFTQCVQQFSYVYALVRRLGSDEGWRLDYIRVHSGCSCQLIPPPTPTDPQGVPP